METPSYWGTPRAYSGRTRAGRDRTWPSTVEPRPGRTCSAAPHVGLAAPPVVRLLN